MLLTFALALVIEGVLGYLFTNIYRSTTPSYTASALLFGPYYLPEVQFYATLMSMAILGLLWAFLQYTRMGYAIRATMQNRTAAQVVGVNVGRIDVPLTQQVLADAPHGARFARDPPSRPGGLCR